MVVKRWSKADVDMNLVKECAIKGMSINQTMRVFDMKSDTFLRRCISDDKVLVALFKKNGIMAQRKAIEKQKRFIYG